MIDCNCADDDASDSDLIACIQSGRSACAERGLDGLLQRYKPMMSGAVGRACRSVSSATTLDAADLDAAGQGARLGLYEAARKYDPSKGVPFAGMAGAYVHGAARRELLMQLGWTTDGVRPPCALVEDIPATAVPSAPAVDEVVEGRTFGRLTPAMLALGDSAVRLIADLFVFDMSVTEIAAARGVRQQTITAQRRRALTQLQQTVERNFAA